MNNLWVLKINQLRKSVGPEISVGHKIGASRKINGPLSSHVIVFFTIQTQLNDEIQCNRCTQLE